MICGKKNKDFQLILINLILGVTFKGLFWESSYSYGKFPDQAEILVIIASYYKKIHIAR